MSQQLILAVQSDAGFEVRRRAKRRDLFLAEMDKVVPRAELCAVIEPFPSQAVCRWGCRSGSCGAHGALPLPAEGGHALPDTAVDESTYHSPAMGGAVGIDLGRESPPDATTICMVRRLLEHDRMAEQLCACGGLIGTPDGREANRLRGMRSVGLHGLTAVPLGGLAGRAHQAPVLRPGRPLGGGRAELCTVHQLMWNRAQVADGR